MSNRSCNGFDVHEPVVASALEHRIQAREERFTLAPLCEQRRKDVCADCQKQNGRLSFENAIAERKVRITEITYSKDRRPNYDVGSQERSSRGKDWLQTAGKPQQNRKRPGDRQQHFPSFARQRNDDLAHHRERQKCESPFDVFPPQ